MPAAVRRLTRSAAIAALLVTGLGLIPRPPIVAVTDVTAGNVVLCRPLADDGRVALIFTHSMYGGDVIEEFVAAGDGRMRRTGMTAENAAAAEYYAYSRDVMPEGARFRIDLPEQDFEELIVRVDRIGEHRLIIASDEIDLLSRTGDRHQVRIQLRSSGPLDRVRGRAC